MDVWADCWQVPPILDGGEIIHALTGRPDEVVFVILAAFWGQVDYRARQLMPWQLMARAATPAANSLLLDYVSAGIVFGLFKSLKRSHYLIVLVISGSLLLQLATVFSTGLFLLENVQMEDFGTPIETTSRFDGSDFDSTLVDSRPVHTVYAIQHLNLSFPAGTNDRYAVQTLTALRSNLSTSFVVIQMPSFHRPYPRAVSSLWCEQ